MAPRGRCAEPIAPVGKDAINILKNMKVNGKDYIPCIMANKKCGAPKRYVCWFRFAPVTSSLFAYHSGHSEIGVV